jgi:hypothetical protein
VPILEIHQTNQQIFVCYSFAHIAYYHHYFHYCPTFQTFVSKVIYHTQFLSTSPKKYVPFFLSLSLSHTHTQYTYLLTLLYSRLNMVHAFVHPPYCYMHKILLTLYSDLQWVFYSTFIKIMQVTHTINMWFISPWQHISEISTTVARVLVSTAVKFQVEVIWFVMLCSVTLLYYSITQCHNPEDFNLP